MSENFRGGDFFDSHCRIAFVSAYSLAIKVYLISDVNSYAFYQMNNGTFNLHVLTRR